MVRVAILLRVHLRAVSSYGRDQRVIVAGRIVTHHLVVLLFVLAGIGGITGAMGGLYWIAPPRCGASPSASPTGGC